MLYDSGVAERAPLQVNRSFVSRGAREQHGRGQRLRRATAAARVDDAEAELGVQTPWPDAVCLRICATCGAVRDGLAAQTSAAAPATCGAANEVPLRSRRARAARRGGRCADRERGGCEGDRAEDVFARRGERDASEPVFENDARAPDDVDAADGEPAPPAPFEPSGWSSAAGYSTGLPAAYSLPDGGDERARRARPRSRPRAARSPRS